MASCSGPSGEGDDELGEDADTSSANTSGADTSSADTSSDTTGEGECATWCPTPGTTWQWQLSGTIDTQVDVAMFDVDLFDTPITTLAALHDAGRIVVCYFSAGSHEDWRPDAAEFPAAALGEPLDGWPGERWLDIRDPQVRVQMQARLDLAVEHGCDAVEPDNVDAWANPSGFSLSAADQLDYNRFLADEAHARGLSIGLKNDLDQIADLVDDFDWALNEECSSYAECDQLAPFLAANKAVFHVEYVDDPSEGPALAEQVCPAVPEGFSTLVKVWDLDAWRIACP